MKLSRLVIPVLLFLIAAPSFAVCGICDLSCNCSGGPGSNSRCKPTIDCCMDMPATCLMATERAPLSFVSNFTIASVEVTTPAKHVVTTTEPRLAERTSHPDSHAR